MDKYTVDLDQVLNDFEYSELTDSQQNIAHRSSASSIPSQITNVFPSTSQTAQHKVKNVNSKHSITNVFNSLNEYLNSDIKLSKENSSYNENNSNNLNFASKLSDKDNVYKDRLTTAEQDYSTNFKSTTRNNVTFESAKYLDKEDGFMIEKEPVKDGNNVFTDEEDEDYEDEENTELKTDKSAVQNSDEPESFKNLSISSEQGNISKSDETDRNVSFNEAVIDNITEDLQEIPKSLLDDESNEQKQQKSAIDMSTQNDNITIVNSTNINVNINSNDEISCINESLQISIDSLDVQEELCNEDASSCDLSYSENTVNNELIKINDSIADNNMVCSTKEKTNTESEVENKQNDDKPNDENKVEEKVILKIAEDETENTTLQNEQVGESQKLIGFDSKLEIDDSQLNKYLEEIEQEFEELQQELPQDSQLVLKKQKIVKLQITNKSVKEPYEEIVQIIDQENSVDEELLNDNDKENKNRKSEEENDEIGKKSEIVMSDTVEENMKDNNENENKHINMEGKEVEEVNTETLDVNVSMKEDGNCDVSETVSISEDAPSCSSEDVNSSSRPTTLDLSYDSSESKKEINLIGGPGSTPYNNLYVSKELPVKEPHPSSDSDSTCSASPTFSNASTNSVQSTETSTDSLNDVAADENLVVKVAHNNSNGKELSNNSTNETQAAADKANSDGVSGSAENSNNSDAALENSENNTSETNPSSDQANELSVEDNTARNLEESVNLSNDGLLDQAMALDPTTAIYSATWLGKRPPNWIPDSQAHACLHCEAKFTVIKRRHHCRACGFVLCSKCCNSRLKLDFLDAEARVCSKCFDFLTKDTNSSSESDISSATGNSPSRLHQPNPNNPMEYCSVVPPLQQVANLSQNPPSVMVPVGVLKRKGSSKKSNKSVMFCDGIRPGSDLTNLDQDFNYNETKSSSSSKKSSSSILSSFSSSSSASNAKSRNMPMVDPTTNSFIPSDEASLPPTVTVFKSDISYTECANSSNVVEMLKNEALTFAIHPNLYVHVKIINMNCCMSKTVWCFSSEGLITVGQDEVVYLIECLPDEKSVPKDLFFHIHSIFHDAVKGTTITEMSISLHPTPNFLGCKNHAGFLYIRPTFQCLKNVIIPKELYLVGILIHRWEIPWAKILPLRLILRLGAEYRYYPSPIISTRNRESVFVEIGHTFINLLADFRNFVYTLPNIMGLTIHMEEKNITITIPSNRYDQVMKCLNQSSEHILAFAGNFCSKADTHLVCIQDTQSGSGENNYTTHTINIENKPHKITGATFIVFNGALKSSSGLTAKSDIKEDGLMIQIPPESMVQVRDSLRNMKNHTIHCGCINAESDETVNIIWGDPDVNFNINAVSPIDKKSLSGIPSIRVHNGKDFVCNSGNRLIRWTEVFILQNGDENARTQQDPVDISKLADSISKATCQALVKYLDLLASNNFYKVGIRTNLQLDNVSYSAGSNGVKLPPIYMRSLDNELISVLHRITSNNFGDNTIILELIFRILNV